MGEALKNFDAVLVRSATQVRKEHIDIASNLRLIGRAGVGMDNIDVKYAREKGLAVVNTPAASSQSVAELVFAHLFTGVRYLHDANRNMPACDTKESFDKLKKIILPELNYVEKQLVSSVQDKLEKQLLPLHLVWV